MSFPFPLPLILDGATGTNLIAAGMPGGVCVETWILEHPEVLKGMQQAFIDAGSNAVYAPTFGANREKLKAYGLENRVEELNLKLVELTRSVAKPAGVLVGGDVSPAGLMIEPYGDAGFDELYDIYLEQISALKKAGVDFIGLETQMSLADMRAGVLAAKAVGLPVFVSLTVEDNGRTIMGTRLLPALITLQAMGADAIGLNCSTGPEIMKELLPDVLRHSAVPLIAKPNAGKPDPMNPGKYSLTPELFAQKMDELLRLGVQIVGGCCGTTPEHIEKLSALMKENAYPVHHFEPDHDAAAIESEAFFLPDDLVLSEPLECSFDLSDDLIDVEDEEVGGDQVNVAVVRVNTIEEAKILVENASMTRLPIDVLTDDKEVLSYTLRAFQGRLLIDSESELCREDLEAEAKRYGAIVY